MKCGLYKQNVFRSRCFLRRHYSVDDIGVGVTKTLPETTRVFSKRRQTTEMYTENKMLQSLKGRFLKLLLRYKEKPIFNITNK